MITSLSSSPSSLHNLWSAVAQQALSRPPSLEGESKMLWEVTPDTLAEYGLTHDRSVCIVRLKPTVYSYTGQRDEVIPGTELLRLKATEIMWGWLKDAGIDVPVHHMGTDYYIMDIVKAPPIETVVKAAHVGTPKHRLYGVEHFATRFGKYIRPDHSHEPYVRFDWRNPKLHPETKKPLADECIPEEFADNFIDVSSAKVTARKSFDILRDNLNKRGVELQDICFFIAENGLTLFSEVSPDGLRAKWLGQDLDKDDFRKGNNAASVVDAYALLVGIIESKPGPYTANDKQAVIDRTKAKYRIASSRPSLTEIRATPKDAALR